MEHLRKLKERLAFRSRWHDDQTFSSTSDRPLLDPTKGIKLPPLRPSVEEFAKLQPVHQTIMDYLFLLRPQLVVSLSLWHYNHYVSILYRHVTLKPSSFAGLFRSYGRGEPWDNRTIRAYRNHTNTVRLFDKRSAYDLCTLTYGDQPVYVPHKDLFLNVTKIELSWEVMMLQVQAGIHYLHSNIAGQLGQHLKEGIVEEMVIEMQGALERSGMQKAIADLERECKPKMITCLFGPTWGLSEQFEVYPPDRYISRVPVFPKDVQYMKVLRIVFAPRLGKGWDDRPILQDIRNHVRSCAPTQFPPIPSVGTVGSASSIRRTNNQLKIEYHIPRAASTRAKLAEEFRKTSKHQIVAWMDNHTEFHEVDGRRLWIGWSDLWQEARGRKAIKMSDN
ncbi:hypothetical protein I317_01263 [Kwoniella heveanensis CBS 569]|nr:hypothetical protein I317_01263 [Kwoniella heveanensis CBS 569]